jgi:hypothetical protein
VRDDLGMRHRDGGGLVVVMLIVEAAAEQSLTKPHLHPSSRNRHLTATAVDGTSNLGALAQSQTWAISYPLKTLVDPRRV